MVIITEHMAYRDYNKFVKVRLITEELETHLVYFRNTTFYCGMEMNWEKVIRVYRTCLTCRHLPRTNEELNR